MANGQNAERLVLVTGSTGNQGGAVASSLFDRGFAVRALTREPDKPEARDLGVRGAEVVRGTSTTVPQSIRRLRVSTESFLCRIFGRPATTGSFGKA